MRHGARLAAWLAAMALLSSVGACGGGGNDEASTPATGAAVAATTAPATTAPAAAPSTAIAEAMTAIAEPAATPETTGTTAGAVETSSDALEALLEQEVHAWVDENRSTGIVAGLVLPDGSTRVVAYGDSGTGRPLDGDSVFGIASLTKLFTATLLAEMVERGEVALDDPVDRYLPDGVEVPSRNGREITLLDLATHFSGLPENPPGLESTVADPIPAYPAAALWAFLRDYELQRDPGERYLYSNVGMRLLGDALALRAGTSYERLLRERVARPLDLSATAIAPTPAMRPNVVVGHDERAAALQPYDPGSLGGAGALHSTAHDLLRFAAASLEPGDDVLGRAMAAATAPHRRINYRGQVGLGWHLFEPEGTPVQVHEGALPGFTSIVLLDRARDVALVALSNSSQSSSLLEIADAVLGA